MGSSSPTRILIGIQARSTSERFPRKIFEKIGNKTMLQHCISNARKSAQYLNTGVKERLDVSVAILVPEGDEIVSRPSDGAEIFQGPEHDVLTRYVKAAETKDSDYIVRLTADCPLIPPFLISKHVLLAVENGYDYLSNVWEDARTAPDGFDIEVMSRQTLLYLDRFAVDAPDREHVTPYIRKNPRTARVGCVVSFLQLAGLKLSVDTPEDLDRVRREYEGVETCNREAHARFGKFRVHRV